MRFSTIQIAALALALGVSAAPSVARRDCDLDLPSNSTGSAVEQVEIAAASSSTKKASTKTKTTKSSTKTKKSSTKTKTSKTSTKTKAAESAATTTAAAEATATDSGSAEETGSASSAVASADAPAVTSAATPASTGTVTSGGDVPASSGTSVLKAAQTIAAGASFDGGMVMFDRGVSCTGQAEGGDSDAVFQIEVGGSLSNVIIGPNQIEGVHCQGACTLTNVWWTAVCEDAFTIKNQEAGETTKIIGGGAFGAADKVLQHNGAGTLNVSGFTVGSFGKLYRACGNCATSHERHVIMDDITATDGEILAGVNGNFGDTATITNSKLSKVESVCTNFKGVAKGSEPTKVEENVASSVCIFGSDVVSS